VQRKSALRSKVGVANVHKSNVAHNGPVGSSASLCVSLDTFRTRGDTACELVSCGSLRSVAAVHFVGDGVQLMPGFSTLCCARDSWRLILS